MMSISTLESPNLDLKQRLVSLIEYEKLRTSRPMSEYIYKKREEDLNNIVDRLSLLAGLTMDVEIDTDGFYITMKYKDKKSGLSVGYEPSDDRTGEVFSYYSTGLFKNNDLIFIGTGSLEDCFSDGLKFLKSELK